MLMKQFRSSTTFAVLVVCVAVFTDIFLYGLVVPMLPFALAERVGLTDADIQHWNSILLASYGASIMLGSYTSLLIHGYSAFWMDGRSNPHEAATIFARGRGYGRCDTALLTYQIIGRDPSRSNPAGLFDCHIGEQHIGRAIGFTSMSLSVGLFAGPIVGGFLYDLAGYFAVFVPAFVLVVLEFVLRVLLIRPSLKTDNKRNLTEEERRPLMTDAAGTPTTVSPRKPALLYLLCMPRFITAMTGMFMLNSFMTALEAVLPVYLPQVFPYRSTEIAIVFLSNTLPMICSPIGGAVVDRMGPFWPAVLGFTLITPSMMLLSLVREPEMIMSVLLRLFLFLFGCGVSLAMPAMMTEITLAKDDMEDGYPGIFGDGGASSQAYGLSNAAFAAGTLVGPLYAGYIRESVSWSAMVISLGAFSALMVVFVVAFTPLKGRVLHGSRVPDSTRQ
ncbi:Ankyrin repeats (3 copies) family protein [Aspergillus niger]|uniref:Ankyrin repeats (3 copies) family protein n=1 Tax=Aspergillus niger TaxID=5061 RepID=A0A505IFR4_ASPNG|nr:Ankyrin repeats (3 copies) family protein [Aspergillus niger]GJP90828.1 MFS amine transporter [Aspergillus niger]